VTVHELPTVDRSSGTVQHYNIQSTNCQIEEDLDRDGPFDVVYERYSLWSFAGMHYARSAGIPGILEVNAPLIDEQIRYRGLVNPEAAEHVAERAFHAASMLVAVSDEVATYLNHFGMSHDCVHVIPNGVDTKRFDDQVEPSHATSADCFTVGFVGSMKKWHGIDQLIDAFGCLAQVAADCRLLLVGEGPESESLKTQAQTAVASGRGNVQMVGAVSHAEIPALLTSMDVAVASYPDLADFYFSPLKVYEYMAAGRPVIASRVGQLSQLIEDGVNGVLYKPEDPAALSAALISLYRNPEQRAQLGRNARSTVVRHHSWNAALARIMDLANLEAGCVVGGKLGVT
jgi:glycosyltransferase involved in cell wall biosynthesis